MMHNKIIQSLLLTFLFSLKSLYGDNIFIIIAQKEAEKKSRGWSLIEWLETKKKFALMDQWLALNTKPESLFEGLIGISGEYEKNSPLIHRPFLEALCSSVRPSNQPISLSIMD